MQRFSLPMNFVQANAPVTVLLQNTDEAERAGRVYSQSSLGFSKPVTVKLLAELGTA